MKKVDKYIINNTNRSFFVKSNQTLFLSRPLKLALSKIWIWNNDIFQYLSHNRSFFINFTPFLNQFLIKKLRG